MICRLSRNARFIPITQLSMNKNLFLASRNSNWQPPAVFARAFAGLEKDLRASLGK